ncbi:Transcription factor [Penicillium cf. griseofulvum]|nr:Transcription factor [Penicillium cf. griseofulvum]
MPTGGTDVSRRCSQARASLPEHLHYTPECWGTDLPTSVKLALLISYFAYLYNEFLVQSLSSKDSGVTDAAQLDVSATILSAVLTLGRQWEQLFAIQRDFTWIQQARTGQAMLYSGSRSSLIRNLSVFISHLESMTRPGHTSFSFFSRAASAFSRIIDEILEPQSEVSMSCSDIENTLEIDLEGIELLDTTDFRASFNQIVC